MASYSRSIIVLLLSAVLTAGAQFQITPRLIGGVPVDTLRRFPHHVTIQKDEEHTLCAGSILNEQWILTSALCVDGSKRLQLHFEKLYYLSTDGSYTAVVNNDAIRIYPTYYDDIALIKIPFRLVFSDTIKPVNISSTPINQLQGRLAVMPGFDVQEQPRTTTPEPWSTTTRPTTTDLWYYTTDVAAPQRKRRSVSEHQLTYGMFNILSNTICKNSDTEFDEYLQLCTESWANNNNAPCLDYGSGLLVGWPAKSELVGIYSVSLNSCNSSRPAIYTDVSKYSSWIYNTIRN